MIVAALSLAIPPGIDDSGGHFAPAGESIAIGEAPLLPREPVSGPIEAFQRKARNTRPRVGKGGLWNHAVTPRQTGAEPARQPAPSEGACNQTGYFRSLF